MGDHSGPRGGPLGMLDDGTMRMFEAFNLFMRQQQVDQRREALATKALHSIVNKMDQFDGRDISKYVRFYAREMELNRVSEHEMVESFELSVVPEIRGRVRELRENDGGTWGAFVQALKEEFFMEDSERVTKRTFLEWVVRPNKGLSANELLREFERQYVQLTGTEKTTLEVEKTELFIQAADPWLQEMLEPLLEDRNEERGLKTEWKEVEGAVSLLTKRQRRRDKSIVSDAKPEATPMAHYGGKPSYGKPHVSPKLDDPGHLAMDELVKGMRELKLKMAKIEEKTHGHIDTPNQSSGAKSGSSGGRLPPRCMWCDSFEHPRRDCTHFTEALRNNIAFFKEGRIHSRETGLPLETNFGKGGMKALVEGTSKVHANSSNEGITYGVGLVRDCAGSSVEQLGQKCALWPDAMKFAESKEFSKDTLHLAGESIRHTTGWNDPVDSLSVHAYIARSHHEAVVEEKRKRDETGEGPSKRVTRSEKGKQPTREEAMKDASSKEKGKAPAYKLQSDIEAATDLKKVLEDRILSGKVEFTLGEVLGIAKREFHEVIIDIIKRKRQTMGDVMTSNVQGRREVEEENEEEENDNVYGGVSRVGLIGEEGEILASSHFSRNHWARATTETLVKLGDLEEPLVALVDHGSEINLMSRELYERGKWPIDIDHGWLIRAANNSRGSLYGACPNVKVMIGDVSDEQNFFVQDSSTYPIILGQPYITSMRMETKVMDNGSAYARIRSQDGKRAVQFLTVCANHERNRDTLRARPLPRVNKEFGDHHDHMGDFHHMPL